MQLKIIVKKSLLIFLFISFQQINAQQFYRFKADVTIKDKLANGKYRLTIGSVYYDKLYSKIVYKLSFPKKETIVMQDTTLYTINEKNIIEKAVKTAMLPEFTAFHLALTGQLSEYGLKPKSNERSVFKITKIEKTAKGVQTTWSPIEAKLREVFGDIKMLNVDKKLDTMTFYDAKGKIVSQQYFKKYVSSKGISFPTEIIMVNFTAKGERSIQLTTYKNVQIDQNNEDEIYRYRLPIRSSAGLK